MTHPVRFAVVAVVAAAIGIAGDLTPLGQRGAKLILLAMLVLSRLGDLKKS